MLLAFVSKRDDALTTDGRCAMVRIASSSSSMRCMHNASFCKSRDEVASSMITNLPVKQQSRILWREQWQGGGRFIGYPGCE